MPMSCVANGCTNRYTAGREIHFFRFPLANKLLTKRWVSALKRKQFIPTKWSRICSVHFTERDFQVRPGAHRPLLKNSAVPSVFPSYPSFLHEESLFRNQITVTNDHNYSDQSIENYLMATTSTDNSCNKEKVHTTSTLTENHRESKDEFTPFVLLSIPVSCQKSKKISCEESLSRNPIDDHNYSLPLKKNNPLATSFHNRKYCDKEIQTTSSFIKEDILKKKIKTLQQHLRRQKVKINNLTNSLNNLKQKRFIDKSYNKLSSE